MISLTLSQEWAGGETDFSKAPFTMNVKSVYAKDYNGGGPDNKNTSKEYNWDNMDASGSWEKVNVVA